MSGLTDLLFELVGEFLALPAVGLAVNVSAFLLVTLWLASAWWAYRDARRRANDPFTPFLVATGVLVLTPLLFPMALVVWRVLRPSSTLRERYAADLQRELLVAGAERSACPACARSVEDDWVRCPSCKAALAAACAACDRPVGLEWSICAWCATELAAAVPASGPATEAATAPAPAASPVHAKEGAARAPAPSLRRSTAALGITATSR